MKLSSPQILLRTLFLTPLLLAGCTQHLVLPANSATDKVTHLIYSSYNPNDINDVPTRLEFFLSDVGDRMTIEEYGDDFPEYWLSETTTGNEYFTGPVVSAQMRQEVPPASPYKNVSGPTIIKLDLSQRADAEQMHLPRHAAAELLTVDPAWLDSTKTTLYEVVVPTLPEDAVDNGQRRITLDPKTQQITQIEKFTLDAQGNEQLYEKIIVQEHTAIATSELPKNFFTLADWQLDLPEEQYTIVTDDLD